MLSDFDYSIPKSKHCSWLVYISRSTFLFVGHEAPNKYTSFFSCAHPSSAQRNVQDRHYIICPAKQVYQALCLDADQEKSYNKHPSWPKVIMDPSGVCPIKAPHWRKPFLPYPLQQKIFGSDIYHLSPRYTKEQILAVRTAHRKAHTWQDRAALGTVRLLRWGMDVVSGYHTRPTNTKAHSKSHLMTEEKWITRFVFLESVAGVPGMVAGMLRHLKSIRRMRRDNGWWVNTNYPPLSTWERHLTSHPIQDRNPPRRSLTTNECTS
jgi:Alternative oxidase.